MANDISGITNSKPQQANNRGTTQVKRNDGSNTQAEQSNASASNQVDKVSLTETAAKLKELENQLNVEPAIDENRVADVKAAMNNGEYYVDANKVAEKMINIEKEFDV